MSIIEDSRLWRGDDSLARWTQSQFDKAMSRKEEVRKLVLFERPVNGSECLTIEGEVLKPVYGKRETLPNGKVVGTKTGDPNDPMIAVEFVKELIKVPIRAEHFDWFRVGVEEDGKYKKRGFLRPVRFSADDFRDSQERLLAYQWALQKKARKGKILIGNLKSRESILYYATPRILSTLFGYNFLQDKNPAKLVDLWRTTSKMEFVYAARDKDVTEATATDEKIRIRIVRAMNLGDLLPEAAKNIHGIPVCDGNAYAWFGVKFFQKPEEGKEKATTKTLTSCAQVRINLTDLAVKANVMTGLQASYHYFSLSRHFGFDPFEADMIMSLDNVKNKNSDWEHGDIVVIDASDLRIIGVASRKKKSSYGVQLLCMGEEVAKFGEILVEHGLPEKAQQVRRAMDAKLDDVINVIFGQSNSGKFEDNREMYAKSLFAIKREGQYYFPMYQSNVNTLKLRINRMVGDEILKYKVSRVSAYVMPNNDLDLIEWLVRRKTKDVYRYFVPPSSRGMKEGLLGIEDKGILPKKHCLIGGNPVVWPGSIFPGTPLRMNTMEALREWKERVNYPLLVALRQDKIEGYEYDVRTLDDLERKAAETMIVYNPATDTSEIIFNATTDTVEISNASAYMMFRDFDGDVLTICFTDIEQAPAVYPTVLRPASPEGKVDKPTTMEGYVRHLKEVARMIAQAAMDTGLVDLECRRIYVRRLITGKFLTWEQAFRMGCLREDQIQGLKHIGAKAQDEEAVDTIRDKFDIKVPGIKPRPLEYQIVHRNAGISRSTNPHPTDAQVLDERLDLINTAGYRFNPAVPQWAGLKEFKGAKIVTRHMDSEHIRLVMKKRWDFTPKRADYDLNTPEGKKAWQDAFGMVQIFRSRENAGLTHPFKLYLADAGDRPSVVDMAENLRTYYDTNTSLFIADYEEDRDSARKAERFRQLGKDIRIWLEEQRGIMEQLGGKEGALKWERYLAVYFCTVGFGARRSQQSGRLTSKAGSALWFLSDDALIFAAHKFDPNNPELLRARKRLADLAKQDENSQHQAAIPDEDEEAVTPTDAQ